MERMTFNEFYECAEQLQNYNFIRFDKKKELKHSFIGLAVELNKLLSELEKNENRDREEE